jgi:hypothetical protein
MYEPVDLPWEEIKNEWVKGVAPSVLAEKYGNGLTAQKVSSKAYAQKWGELKQEAEAQAVGEAVESLKALRPLALQACQVALQRFIASEKGNHAVVCMALKLVLAEEASMPINVKEYRQFVVMGSNGAINV